jgi:hypothetical protein
VRIPLQLSLAAVALFAIDRRDLDAAWHRAHATLEVLPGPRSASGNTSA